MTQGREIGALLAGDLERMDRWLGSFLDRTGARCALVVDRSGRLLAAAGETAALDGVAFASLAAADFAANDQLALLLGEKEFSSLYHQGERQSMFLADLSGRAILATLFDGRSSLGMVRMHTRAMAPELSALLAELGTRPAAGSVVLGSGWADAAADEIDRLFGE